MKIAIYARVSTDKQDNENQLVQLREFAAKQGWNVFAEYVDRESGAKSDRVEFQRMFTDASRRKFDLVLFWALDRLSREGVLQTLQHLNRLENHGVGFRSFTEQYFDSGKLSFRSWQPWQSRSGFAVQSGPRPDWLSPAPVAENSVGPNFGLMSLTSPG
jgi:DNA invertase Pin-like site-specific DNA recombinase